MNGRRNRISCIPEIVLPLIETRGKFTCHMLTWDMCSHTDMRGEKSSKPLHHPDMGIRVWVVGAPPQFIWMDRPHSTLWHPIKILFWWRNFHQEGGGYYSPHLSTWICNSLNYTRATVLTSASVVLFNKRRNTCGLLWILYNRFYPESALD